MKWGARERQVLFTWIIDVVHVMLWSELLLLVGAVRGETQVALINGLQHTSLGTVCSSANVSASCHSQPTPCHTAPPLERLSLLLTPQGGCSQHRQTHSACCFLTPPPERKTALLDLLPLLSLFFTPTSSRELIAGLWNHCCVPKEKDSSVCWAAVVRLAAEWRVCSHLHVHQQQCAPQVTEIEQWLAQLKIGQAWRGDWSSIWCV